jgi:hypothetical protein
MLEVIPAGHHRIAPTWRLPTFAHTYLAREIRLPYHSTVALIPARQKWSSSMRARLHPFLLVAFALPLLAGCEKSPKERIQGKWRGVGVEKLAGPQAKSAEGWAKQTTIEFSGANVTVAIPAEAPQTGTYSVSKIDGDKVTLHFKRPDKSHDDTADFRFTKDGKLVWSLGAADIVMTKAVD